MKNKLLFGMIHDETRRLNEIITNGAKTIMSDIQFLEKEITKFLRSEKRKQMLIAERYYEGDHDILKRKRMVIGERGKLTEVDNLPNNKTVDNQYALLVDQKVNYILSKPLVFETENENYSKLLDKVFSSRFLRILKSVGENSINSGISWLHPHYNEQGELSFKKFEGYEILPFWKDKAHTILDIAVRIYEVNAYEGDVEVIIQKVEVYSINGVERFVYDKGSLIPDIENPSGHHITIIDNEGNESGWNWSKVPLIAFKYNDKEIPLIKKVKSLQDGINIIISDFQNNMQEDNRNTILILTNYDGTNLGEFRQNLAQYGAVKVKSVEGAAGGLEALEVKVNSENHKAILKVFKNAIIENGRGFNAKDDRIGANPNQMNIQSMYSDIDLDANGIETEFQAAFEEILWFVNIHLFNTAKGDFTDEKVKIIFNRDILINESESIEGCKNSIGILSHKTIVAQHPWITDVGMEINRIKEEEQTPLDSYANNFLNNDGLANGE